MKPARRFSGARVAGLLVPILLLTVGLSAAMSFDSFDPLFAAKVGGGAVLAFFLLARFALMPWLVGRRRRRLKAVARDPGLCGLKMFRSGWEAPLPPEEYRGALNVLVGFLGLVPHYVWKARGNADLTGSRP